MAVIRIFIIFLLCLISVSGKYNASWSSLDTRPLPNWYEDAKIGIFVHWGVYSVPAFGNEWFWSNWKGGDENTVEFMKNNYKTDFTYQEFGADFSAEFFIADQWAELFRNSGAKYVVLTSKHHEGYTLWPSKYAYSWNSLDIGAHRDLVGELGEAVRNAGLKFGVYHSLLEWYHPLYVEDRSNSFETSEFVDKKLIPELYELVNNYAPEILWSDGDWETNSNYWKSTEFLAWLYNDSPVNETIVTNDRWGTDANCAHGDYYNCADRFNPGILQKHKWENAFTIDRNSWGYRRNSNIQDYLSAKEIIREVVSTVSCNGSVLINIGPTKDGHIAPIFQERLLSLGQWLSVNGEAIYGSRPWTYQNDSLNADVWYTMNNNSIFAMFLSWPQNNILVLKDVHELFSTDSPPSDVVILQRFDENLKWQIVNNTINIELPDYQLVENDSDAWVIRINKT